MLKDTVGRVVGLPRVTASVVGHSFHLEMNIPDPWESRHLEVMARMLVE